MTRFDRQRSVTESFVYLSRGKERKVGRKGKERKGEWMIKRPYFSARCAIRHDGKDDWYAERVVPDDVDGWCLDPADRRCYSHYYPKLFLYYRSLFHPHYLFYLLRWMSRTKYSTGEKYSRKLLKTGTEELVFSLSFSRMLLLEN